MIDHDEFDVVVVGGGVAGVAAACAAARNKARVLLLERYGVLGGVASVAAVGTVCGLFLRSTEKIAWGCGKFARTFAERHLLNGGVQPIAARNGLYFVPYQIPEFHAALYAELRECEVQIALHATVKNCTAQKSRIEALEFISWNTPRRVDCGALVDASGEAIVPALLGLPRDTEGERQAPALAFGVRHLPLEDNERTLNVMIAKALLASTEVSQKKLGGLALIPGSKIGDTALMKYALPQPLTDATGDLHSATELEARAQMPEVLRIVRNAIPQLKDLAVTWTAPQTGFRTGARPVPRTTLTEAAVLGCEKPTDGVAVGSWPIEIWGANGRAEFTCFKEEDYFLVPAGALQSDTVENLFFGGRCIGSEENAIAAARVIGTALGTGFAAGWLAAAHSSKNESAAAIAELRRNECAGIGEKL